MIKMYYGAKKHIQQLKGDYLKVFQGVPKMQSRWTSIRKRLVKLDGAFGACLPKKVEDVLIMEFEDMAGIYELFLKVDLKSNNTLEDDMKSLFSYVYHNDRKGRHWSKLQPKIASFFMDVNNGFEIHTCHYCDMAYINAFKVEGKNKTQFDLDHVLDKDRCPILALSLFNLVPSCPVCNSRRVKGTRVLYNDYRLRKKLSPSNFGYGFEDKVKIEVYNKKGKITTTGFEKRMDEYEIRFNTYLDPDYEEEVKAFYLNERYNYHKCEALRLLDLKERYTEARILEIARMIAGGSKKKVTPKGMKYITQLKHDIFAKDFGRKFHRSFGKLREDILK